MCSSEGSWKRLLQKLCADGRLIYDMALMLKNRDSTERVQFKQPVWLVLQINEHRLVSTHH